MTYDWGCDKKRFHSTDLTINADGTWSDDTGDSGTWILTGDQVTIYSPEVTYTGTVNENYMSGTLSSKKRSGCWTAVR
jgi:hypothetical protein